MTNRLAIIVSAIVLLSSVSQISMADPKPSGDETITWLAYSLPPYFNKLNKRGQRPGVGDAILKHWESALPNYKHKPITVNIPRMSQLMSTKTELTCTVASFKAEGFDKHYIWGEPIFIEPPAMIIVTEKTWEKLGKPRSVAVDQLLGNMNYKFGMLKSRLYQGGIDKIFANSVGQKNVFTMASSDATSGLLRMLLANRVDWIVAYAPEIQWLYTSKHQSKEKIKTIQIENYDMKLPVYPACSKNSNGKKIIASLNKVIKDKKILKDIHDSYRAWLVDDQSKDLFTKVNRSLFK